MAKKTHSDEDASAFVRKPSNPRTPASEQRVKANQIVLEGEDFNLGDFLTDDMSEEQQEVTKQAILSGADTIELPLGRGNKLITFERMTFQADEIATKTKPHAENVRNSKFFTALDRKVARDMIAESGCNLYPALGWFNPETGVTELYDGFRRSVGCEEFGVALQAYVTKEQIAPQKANKLSRNANDHLSNGLLDLRVAYKTDFDHIQLQQKNEGKDELSQNKVISLMNVPKSSFITAMKSFDVDDSVYSLFPSPTTLGRDALNDIYKEIVGRELSDKEIQDVKDKMKGYVEENIDSMTTNTSNENARALKVFKAIVEEVKPTESVVDDNKFELPSGMGSVSRKRNGQISISLTSLTVESLEAVQAQLKAMLHDAE